MRQKIVFVLAAILVLALTVPLSARDVLAEEESKYGLQFWAVWPPTHQKKAELVVLTTMSSVTATIEFHIDNELQGKTVSASLGTPGILVLDEWADNLTSDCVGGVKRNAIRITTTGPATVLFRTPSGHGGTADDIYLVLPTVMLGNEYWSLSYECIRDCSWYVVIATQDNTGGAYQIYHDGPYNIGTTLNQWDTLTVTTDGTSFKDISGCHVTTSKSVAFVSGCKMSKIPPTAYAADTLMEMLLPVSLWGCDYYTVPLQKSVTSVGDIIRIQASQDATAVYLNKASVGIAIPCAGCYLELDRSDPLYIHSSAPVQVVQYAKSRDESGTMPYVNPLLTGVGDPFAMTIFPAILWWLHDYVFYSPTWGGKSEGSYVTIINQNDANDVHLDGVGVTSWDVDLSSGVKYAVRPVSEGQAHRITSDRPIGVYSYGYEEYGSYGYPVLPLYSPPAKECRVTISSTDGGFVAEPGEGVFTYDEGTVVDLVAEPDEGYTFVNWTGNVTTIANANTANTTITMNGDYSIVANFEQVPQPPCFIASAAYGTPMAKEIEILRQFRDKYLLTNPPGQALVGLYYAASPPIAEFITDHPRLKPIVRTGLMPVVAVCSMVLDIVPWSAGNQAR